MLRRRTSANIGFTLIELLVVIGIIALLISILLPSLGRARAAAQQAVCLSNLRQLSMAAYMYAAENKGLLVPSATVATQTRDTIGSVTGTVVMAWGYEQVIPTAGNSAYAFDRGYLGRYLKSDKVMECPTMAGQPLEADAVGKPTTTYGIALVLAPTVNTGLDTITRFSQIRDASDTVIFGDAIIFRSAGQPLARPVQLTSPAGGVYGGFDSFHGRHASGSGNLGFYDGHAERVLVQARPDGSYNNAGPVSRAELRRNHIGPACPRAVDVSLSTPYAYYTACKSDHDYYFWSDKSAKEP